VFCNFLTNPIRLVFLGIRLKFQKFIQGMEILIVSHWFTFIQQVENNHKLNKFSLVLHYLTTTQLLKDSGCKQSNIRNFIFNMHTFWIHDPLTITTFLLTCMFINRTPFSNQFFFLPFNFGTNMTFHNKNQPNLIKNGL
jgi:hypothetical protein